jgi:uncharacterized protein
MIPGDSRLHIVDALRGFAIVSIILLHHNQHFYFNYPVDSGPSWLRSLDEIITLSLSALFSGKSYGIFALLFGLTFYIQSNNQQQKGKDFRKRFAWRLLILSLFGLVNSAFYAGDIISFYAILGFMLIPFSRLSNKAILIVAVIMLLQPGEWIKLVTELSNPGNALSSSSPWIYYGKMLEFVAGNSLLHTWIGNLTTGKIATVLYCWESGRIFQTGGLFLLGMLAGRESIFVLRDSSIRLWSRSLIIAAITFFPLLVAKRQLTPLVESYEYIGPLVNILDSVSNMLFMLILISGFILLFQNNRFYNYLIFFTLYGRMSLTNYIMQSIIGSFIYFGYGFGLYKNTGATYCLLIGVALTALQGVFCHFWLKNHKRGPLESIWHKLTWIRSS